MHPIIRNLFISSLLMLFLLSAVPAAVAGYGDSPLADSLISLAPNEPTLQEILDSLGYTIDVVNDELGWESFCSVPGTSVAMILERVSESATSANSGWYNAADSLLKTELFNSSSMEGDSVEFVIPDADSIGFYMQPNLTSYDSWYTQIGFNIDSYDHAMVFPTGQAHEYLIAFEDLKDGGDADFNDLIIRVRFQNAAPNLVLPDDMYKNVCFEDYECFMVEASDLNCLGDTLTLEMLEGYGDFTTLTGAGEIYTEVCFLPWAADSTYRFIFKVTDNSGAFDIDTFQIVYDLNSRPQMELPDDFDTLLCDYDSICVPIYLFDPDGDDLEIEFLEGDGSFNHITNSFCFLPDMVDYATYTFALKAYDSCCLEVEEVKPTLTPKPCPRDTITISVRINLIPDLVTVPDFDTVICEPTEICFPVTATDGNEGDVVTITVTPPATYDPSKDEVCIMADQDGDYEIIITATDSICGAQAIDTVNIGVELNNPPELVVPNDTSYYFCSAPDSICFDADVIDADQFDVHTFTLLSGPGTIDPQTGTVCFQPTQQGDFQFIIKVEDICAAADEDTVNISVAYNLPPVLTLPDDYSVMQCEPEEICFQALADDPDLPDDELTFIKVSGFGTINQQTGEVCFTPFGAGDYEFVIRVRDLCGELDQDTLVISIELNSPPTLIAEPYDTVFFCDLGDSACINLAADDPDQGESLTFEQISGMTGSLDPVSGRFCFLPPDYGDYNFEFRVVDHCGAADSGAVMITVFVNQPPEVILPNDYADTACATGELICFDVTINDSDNDYNVEVLPIGYYDNGQACFEATAGGDTTFCLIVRATDICDASGEDTICIDVHYNVGPTIELAPDTQLVLCDLPDSFCVDFVASDPDSPPPIIIFTHGSGVIRNGQACIDIDTAGFYCFTLRATDECGEYAEDDVCVILIENRPPVLTVHNDFSVSSCEPEEICFDNSATDHDLPDDVLTWSIPSGPAGATITQNGRVCFTPPGGGMFSITIRVTDHCGDFDEETVTVTLDLNDPPEITVSPDSLYHEYCGFGAPEQELCFNGIGISDPDDDVETLTVEKISGPGTFDDETLITCFTPPVANGTIEFIYKVTDTCGAYDLDTALFYIYVNEECDSITCLEVWIEDSECVPTNTNLELGIRTSVNVGIAGFDLVVKFDPSAFSLLDVYRGAASMDWEYFTFRTGDIGGCDGVCPDGLIRIVSIADQNNGAPHPPESAYYPEGEIAIMKFYVTSDLNFSGLTYPVDFYWQDCADNGFSSRSGDTLFVEKIIYNPYGVVWDEGDDVNYPESGRYPNIGVPDSCLIGDKTKPQRCVIMHNGSICIIHPDSIDLRGDINLNEIAYEIADAVLFTNYFIYGPAVFDINYDGQVAATDVNYDGRTLTVGDLVYLIRVLTGDAEPLGKLNPYAQSVNLNLDQGAGRMEIRTESDADIGAVYLMFDISKAQSIPSIVEADDLNGMDLEYHVNNDVMRVLIYSFNTDRIAAGENLLGTIELAGEIELISAEMADYFGNDLAVNSYTKNLVPKAYELSQNYPNPFNPETEINLALPEASEWRIDIFNINGQVVETFSGYSDPGTVKIMFKANNLASGMYFYRATANDFTDTKKMILLK
jgi:hypothetical protein